MIQNGTKKRRELCSRLNIGVSMDGSTGHADSNWILAVARDNVDQATWNVDDLLDSCIANKGQDSLVAQGQLTHLILADIRCYFYALTYFTIDLYDQRESFILR
jgi:hypothetical protein